MTTDHLREQPRRWAARVHLVVLVLVSTLSPPHSASAQTLTLSSATIEDLNAAFDAGTLTSERLIELYLARIEAYDQQGPALNAVLWLNREALATARALDAERRATGPRSPLHGIPVVLKDNIDTSDIGNSFVTTLTENTTVVVTNPPASGRYGEFVLKVIQDASGGAFTLTFPASFKWPAGAAPVITTSNGAIDEITARTIDAGTEYRGGFSQAIS